MEVHKKTVVALAEHNRVRLAGLPTPPPEAQGAPGATPSPGGSSPFTENAKRTIPANFSFDPHSLKPLVQTLWAMSVALGHALTAHRQFARIKSSTISPDGMLGGRGYVLGVKDIRQRLYESCEHLSSIVDTIHDEVNAPHWKPKLGELEKSEIDDLKRLLGETEENLEDPEGNATEEMEAIEDGKPQNWKPGSERFDGGEEASGLPSGGDKETTTKSGPQDKKSPKQASGESYDRRLANSSVNPDTLPGPRVKHLDRADTDQQGPFGAVNDEPPSMHDPWSRYQGVEHQNDYSPNRAAESGIPDANSDDTPTEARDFGLGRGGGNDAHGQGIAVPSVYGPASGLPHDPGGKTKGDESDSTPRIELETSGSGGVHASLLPNDDEPPVARSDYYPGPKGNDVASGSELPNDGSPGGIDSDRDMSPNKSERHEQSAPYVLWNDSTHEQRPDYTYMRPPIQGPYTTKQG